MTAGPGRASLTSLPFRLRIAVALVVPALVAGGILIAFHAGWTSPPDHAGAIERGDLLGEWFATQLEEARTLTSAAIAHGFDRSISSVTRFTRIRICWMRSHCVPLICCRY